MEEIASSPDFIESKGIDAWKCPACYYLVTHEAFLNAACDYACPRCRARKLSEFQKIHLGPQ